MKDMRNDGRGFLGQVTLVQPRHNRRFSLAGSSLGAVRALTDDTFSQILSAPRAVIDFWSPACHYCMDYKPVFEELSDKLGSSVVMAAVDVADAPEAVKKYNIQGLPATIFLANGKEVNRAEGSMEEEDLRAEITKAFGAIPSPTSAPVIPSNPSEMPEPGVTSTSKPGTTTAALMPQFPGQAKSFPILPLVGGLAVVGILYLAFK